MGVRGGGRALHDSGAPTTVAATCWLCARRLYRVDVRVLTSASGTSDDAVAVPYSHFSASLSSQSNTGSWSSEVRMIMGQLRVPAPLTSHMLTSPGSPSSLRLPHQGGYACEGVMLWSWRVLVHVGGAVMVPVPQKTGIDGTSGCVWQLY